MFLKSLEINGFKSFADRTKLEFHEGVTGIVGPNGCGKSNVVDAIRWVLGETSAKALRGGEMADVIFNGTDKRKSLGLAEVVLTLGDCEAALGVEFNEVSVGRRVYRDGRGEYLINRKPCRLKDINDLFMDTGIGRSSYSVMEQGKIDMLLSSKPEDRRQVFEEAAGITKFKHQKKEALRKLDYTEANLVRITDVLEEQRRQMGSLQRQASKARRYASLLNQVQVLDTHLSHRQYETLHAEKEELVTSIDSLRRNQEEMQQRIEGSQQQLSEMRANFQLVEREIAELRQRENEMQSRIQGARNRIGFNEERQRELQALIERNESDVRITEEKIQVQEQDLQTTEDNIKSITDQLADQEAELEEQTRKTNAARQDRSDLDRRLQDSRNSLNSTRGLIATLSAQLESNRMQLDANARRLTQIEEEAERVRQESAGKLGERDSLARQRAEFEETRGQVEEELRELEESLLMVQRELAVSREEEKALAKEHTEKVTRLNTLQQLVASGAGLEGGTREVLQGFDDPERFTKAIKGVVANFVDVIPQLIPAIEAALGHHLQAVIVKDAATAQEMVDRLRAGELGQASLVPEDLLQSARDHQLLTVPAGSVGWAMDNVRAEAKVQTVLQSLLTNVLIVENVARALELRKEFKGIAFATLQGDFLSADGVLTGGFRKEGAGSMLERQTEIKKLAGEVKKLETKVAAHEQARADLEQRALSSKDEVDTLKERFQLTRVQLSTVDGQLALVQREAQQHEAKLESLTWEADELNRRQTAGRDKQGELEDRKVEAQESLQTLTRGLAEQEAEVRRVQEAESEANEVLNEMRMTLAVEKRAREALEHQRVPMRNRLAELDEMIRRGRTEIDSYRSRIQQATEESFKLAEESEEIESEIGAVTEERQEREGQRVEKLSAIQEGESMLMRLRNEIGRFAEQRGKEEVRSTQIELRIENVTSMVAQRYQLDLATFRPDSHALLTAIAEQRKGRRRGPETDDAVEEIATEPEDVVIPDGSQPDWAYIESVIGDMRQRLDSMGPVNIDAIAEYEELEERLNLIQSQHDDLVNSKEELLKVIQKINRTTKAMFIETFEKVSANFSSMFVELFGVGAQANLVLQDDDDPLECGIEIIAKPPGKKLQSITLMSGGERSMTAVALLFAIYMVKPSPFCVLDELDAPLDEANILRFCKVLDRFIDESQFIIVTHSKRTMSRADVIYGVSMEEFGVSKTLGVKFSSSKEDGTSPMELAVASAPGSEAVAEPVAEEPEAKPAKKTPKRKSAKAKVAAGTEDPA